MESGDLLIVGETKTNCTDCYVERDTLMLSCSSSVCSAPLISPYQGLLRDIAANMLNLNIVIGTNDRVTATFLGDEERGEKRPREKQETRGRKMI